MVLNSTYPDFTVIYSDMDTLGISIYIEKLLYLANITLLSNLKITKIAPLERPHFSGHGDI